MEIVILVLRLLHIFGGIFWVGASFMLVGFLTPVLQTPVKPAGKSCSA